MPHECNNECYMRIECRGIFDRIIERLESGDDSFREHREELANHRVEMTELRTNMTHLVKSMDNMTRSIWGMVTTIAGVGLGFIIWFIQTN